MTEPITITSPPERPPHNRRKVYVGGEGGVRVPFVEVTLSDSPGRNGAEPNPPVHLYDTSGPGSVPTVGLPSLRADWVAGRGDVEGEVFVQAFTPFHPAIQYARRHDFVGFYEQEIEFREQLKYPPVSRVALLTLKGRNEEKVKFSAEHLKRELEKILGSAAAPAAIISAPADDIELFDEGVKQDTRGACAPRKIFSDLIIAGPAPAPLLRAENFYRYQIMLRTRAMSALSRELAQIIQSLKLPEDVSLVVDIDPVSLS